MEGAAAENSCTDSELTPVKASESLMKTNRTHQYSVRTNHAKAGCNAFLPQASKHMTKFHSTQFLDQDCANPIQCFLDPTSKGIFRNSITANNFWKQLKVQQEQQKLHTEIIQLNLLDTVKL
jgi:hypothetical protein